MKWHIPRRVKSLRDERDALFLGHGEGRLDSTKPIRGDDKATLPIDQMRNEAFKTSEIKGKILNESLFTWHALITSAWTDLDDIEYSSAREDLMRVVSGKIFKRKADKGQKKPYWCSARPLCE